MAYTLLAAMLNAFAADTVLQALLGRKADGSLSIYPVHARDVQDPTYPMITIERFGSGMNMGIFEESDVFATSMDNPRIAINVWDKMNIDNCYQIYDRIDTLLRGKPPVTPLPSNYMTNYRLKRRQVKDNLFDTDTNSYRLYAEYETWIMVNPVRHIAY